MQPRCRSPITSAGCTSSIGTAISSGIRQRMSTPSPAGSPLPAQYCANLNCCIPIISPSTVNPRAPATARPICPSSSSSTVPLRLASALANNPSKNSPRERRQCSLEFNHASLLHAKIYTFPGRYPLSPDPPRWCPPTLVSTGPAGVPISHRNLLERLAKENWNSNSFSGVELQGGSLIDQARRASFASSQWCIRNFVTLFFHLVVILAIDVLLLEQSGFLGSCTVRISWNNFSLGVGG